MKNIGFNGYEKEAEQKWGSTDAYKEYSEKTDGYSEDKWTDVNAGLNDVFAEFSYALKRGETPECEKAQLLVRKLQSFITDNLYTCTNEILSGLGQMYVSDERFKANIDKNGIGTAEFAAEAIKIYCN